VFKIKITLISPYDLNVAYGLRKLSSYLKSKGHKVNLVFLSPGTYKQNYDEKYNKNILKDLMQICKDSKLIGISLMTNYFMKSVQITQYLKHHLKIPIMWGGVIRQ